MKIIINIAKKVLIFIYGPFIRKIIEILNNKHAAADSMGKFPNEIPDYNLRWAYYDEYVAGVKYRNINFKDIKKGGTVFFVQELSNQYDPEAVKIMHNGNHIGYISRDSYIKEMINAYINRNDYLIQSSISYVNKSENIFILELAFIWLLLMMLRTRAKLEAVLLVRGNLITILWN